MPNNKVSRSYSYQMIIIRRTNCNWCTQNNPQEIAKGTGRLRNQKTSTYYSDNSIIKIGQNTEKSPGDLMRVAVTQTPVKSSKLTRCERLSKEYNDNNSRVLETCYLSNSNKKKSSANGSVGWLIGCFVLRHINPFRVIWGHFEVILIKSVLVWFCFMAYQPLQFI